MYIPPRWRKVVRDILSNKARTLLVVLAIAVGVFAFGSVFITQEVLISEMNSGFSESNPANIIVSLSPFDESLLRTVRTIDGVEDAEARATATVNVWVPPGEQGIIAEQLNLPEPEGQWVTMSLVAVPDFTELTIGQISLERGSLDPARRDILIERRSMIPLSTKSLGDAVTVELGDGTRRELDITGVVHDFNATPGNLAPNLTGFVTIDTLRQLGLSVNYDELHIQTTSTYQTSEELNAFADELGDTLDRYGYGVGFVQVQESTDHWASDAVQALVAVLGAIGFLALGLSAFLVVNTVTAILSQQKRQIGMMKSVGARAKDVLGIYLVMAMVFGVLSLGIALPVGIGVAFGLTRVLGFVLNVNVDTFQIPTYVLGLQLLTALVTPLVAAFVPVMSGTRITVREAVSDYGIGTSGGKSGFFASIGNFVDRVVNGLITAIRGLPRPTKLSLRNTFRRKVRLLLTLVTLSMAGAIFIAVVSVRGSLIGEFDKVISLFGYDSAIILGSPEPLSRIQREAGRVDGVTRVEGWGFAQGTVERSDGSDGAQFTIFAPPPDTPFIDADMIEGRWLQPGDDNALVLSSEIINENPDLAVGQTLRVDLGEVTRRMELVGVVNLVGIEFGYAPYDYITRAQGAAGQSFVAIVGMERSTPQFQTEVTRELTDQFKASGIIVGGSQTTSEVTGLVSNLVNIVVGFMMFMALLLAVVGGLGLASTMSLNVLERTREIGVMRAIGASNGSIRSVFLTEGLIIGLMSWVVACIVSVPISIQFAASIGNAFFSRPLDYVFVPASLGAWFIIVMLISAAASLLPSNRAAQVSVRESLAYE